MVDADFMKSLCILILAFSLSFPLSAQIYAGAGGKIAFSSDAPLELIQAESNQLKGLIDAEKQTFAFSIPMTSFQGFNSPLQREHFNENYLESELFPKATFSGKLIEKIDFSKDGTHSVRAKGMLDIHGVKQERIIRSEMTIEDGKLLIRSEFTVFLEEHDISIPKIMSQKIAEEIYVVMEGELRMRGLAD